MKPSKKLEGSSIIWDNAHVIEPALGKCIKATDDEFTAVANYLLTSVAIRWPDDTKLAEHEHDISNFNSFLRNAAHRIAIQMLTLISNCGLVEGGMRLRQKSGFPCIMQQEQSEGVWVDVFDYALCMESTFTDALNQQSSSQDAKDMIKGAVDLSNLLFEDYLDKYTGTSASYDADLVLNGANPDEARNALCATITETVNNYVASSLDLKAAQVDNQGRAALGIGAGIAIIALLGAAIAFPPLAALLPSLLTAYIGVGALGLAGAVLGATATGLGIWAQVIKDNDIAPLENEAAVRRVICLWFTQLETEDDISLADYSAPVDTSEETPDVQKVWELITPLIQMELSYAVGWDLQYTPGKVLSINDPITVNDFPFDTVKMARNCLISISADGSKNLRYWNGQKMEVRRSGNGLVNRMLWAFVCDVLNGVAWDCYRAGAVYGFTDGYIFPSHRVEAGMAAIEAWGLPASVKFNGECEISGPGAYKFPGRVTGKFLRQREHTFHKINPVSVDWLRDRFGKAARYNRITEPFDAERYDARISRMPKHHVKHT